MDLYSCKCLSDSLLLDDAIKPKYHVMAHMSHTWASLQETCACVFQAVYAKIIYYTHTQLQKLARILNVAYNIFSCCTLQKSYNKDADRLH